MKFIIDEQLPQKLALWFHSKGYDAVHADDLPHVSGKLTDVSICKIADKENCVVITKDEDFWKRYLLMKQPKKLLFLTTGNIKNAELLSLFESNLTTLLQLISQNNVVEFNRNGFVIHF
jgi:predicted nuclease of predicted toxin-antitoxin system